MMTNKLKTESMLQQLALFVAKTMNVSSVEAVGIVANSQIGIGLKDGHSDTLSFEDLSSRLMSEVRNGN
jgi:hypothetical protein